MSDAATLALKARLRGHAKTGTVDLRSFDQGVVTTMGATAHTVTLNGGEVVRNYFLDVSATKGRVGRPGLPGVPVIFAFPEGVMEKYDYPLISVRRDDISPNMSRWHPGTLQYRAPSCNAVQTSVDTSPGSPDIINVTGWSQVTERQQASPFDITYTISILARNRGGLGQTNQANSILNAVLRKYTPYSFLEVIDSIGDIRTYECATESINHLDDLPEVADRVIGFAVTIRVEAELDLGDETLHNTVTTNPRITTEVL